MAVDLNRRGLLRALGAAALGSAGAGVGLLTSRGIKPNTTQRILHPQRIVTSNDGLFVDFGKAWFGNIAITPDDDNKQRSVVIRMGEKLADDGKIDRAPFGSVRYYEVETVLSGTYSPPLTPADIRGMPLGRPAMPFRYLEIDGWRGSPNPGAILLEAVVANEAMTTGRIRFTGNSETARKFNRLMELGEHTMEATSFMGVFIDGDRERIPYEADGLINQLGWYATTGDWKVPRRTIEALLRQPSWPSEWMVQLIFMVWEDYLATGDKAFLRSIYAQLKTFSLEKFIDHTGLVTTVQKKLAAEFVRETGADYLEDIVDWPPGERDGYEMCSYNTVVNCFVCAGLQVMGTIAERIGRGQEAVRFATSAAQLRTAIHRNLISERSGLFIDGLGSNHSAAHSTFVPLAFNLVPSERIGDALAHLKSRIASHHGGFPCSVYGAQYLLQALFRYGEGKAALELMLNDSERGWMHMLDAYDATVTHEAWDVRYKDNIDWNHAWGAAFVSIAQRFILGARMLEPRWTRWTLSPPADIGEPIDATVPTPNGLIHVSVDAARREITVRPVNAATFVPSTPSGEWTISIR